METAVLVAVCILAGVVGGAAAAILYNRRELSQMRELLRRLEEQAARASERPETREQAQGAESPPSPAAEEEGSLSAVTADVLAGHTEQVEAILASGDTRGLSLADQAIVQIYARLEEPLSPSDVARSLNVSLRSLQRGLSMSLGCTPRQLILAVKMREARRLLETGELNVTGVAYRLGFSSPSHFSRRFTRFYRRPPSELSPRSS